jgi:hypothetical protein
MPLKAIDQRAYNTVTAALFVVIAIVQLLRVVFAWPVQIGTVSIPLWCSVLAFVIAGTLAYLGFRQNARSGGAEG